MIYRTVLGVAVMVGSVALVFAKPADTSDDSEQLLKRVSVSMVRLTTKHGWRLGAKISRNQLKILRVDEFDPETISVRATSPTELHLIGLKEGWTEMTIAYDDLTVERIVVAVEKNLAREVRK